MDNTANSINWFEIPVADMERAKKFYEALFDMKMQTIEMLGNIESFFPNSQNMEGKVSGALVKGPNHKPSSEGVLIYLNANPDIQIIIDRIEPNGGRLLMPRTLITEDIGCMAIFMDSEGNRVALHAAK
ncbi:MAG: VOC family protein [Bacteroidota bacterium]